MSERAESADTAQQLAAFDPEREVVNAEMKFTESGVGLIEFQLVGEETVEVHIPRERAEGLWKMIRDQCESYDDTEAK